MARVLIADDSAFMRRYARGAVESAGHEVVGETDDGRQAVALYRSVRPDVGIFDITMFGQTGLEALRDIISDDADARIVICSSQAHRENAMAAVRLGARDFVVKPFEATRLASAVERALQPRSGTASG